MDEEERESRIAAFRREVHEAVSSIRVSIESTIRARRKQLSWNFGPLLKDAVAKLTEGFAGDGTDVARALNQPENFLSEQLLIIFPHKYLFFTSSTAQGGGGSFKNRKPIGEIGCCESGMAERSH